MKVAHIYHMSVYVTLIQFFGMSYNILSNVKRFDKMDIWQKLYEAAKKQYRPTEVNEFIYAHHVVSALEAENGDIYTGFCIEGLCGTMNLCAERTAALNMYLNSDQTKIKRLIAFRDEAPVGITGMPCGVCREFLMQLSSENANTEIMVDYDNRESVTLKELLPKWWGHMRE